jgi:hypothetical protein
MEVGERDRNVKVLRPQKARIPFYILRFFIHHFSFALGRGSPLPN